MARGWILSKLPVLLISLCMPHLTLAYAVQLEMLQQVPKTPFKSIANISDVKMKRISFKNIVIIVKSQCSLVAAIAS